MRKSVLVLASLMLVGVSGAFAQSDKSKRPSPPAVAEGTIDGVKVKVDYSQPSAKGRKVMGGLVPYGEVWRTGANEATVIEFDKDVFIEGQPLAAGKYALFSIPTETEWTIIFNKKTNQWGSYDYAKTKDQNALEVKVKPSSVPSTETFTFRVEKNAVSFAWETTAVAFKVSKK